MKPLLKGMNLPELEQFVAEMGEKRFRARQLFLWMYRHNVADFQQMSEISLPFREKLSREAELHAAKLDLVQISRTKDTRKYLFCLQDNSRVEAVLMVDGNRRTLCISTQVGCPIDCKFCATGLMGLKRNLSAGEIVDQVLLAERESGNKITNIVVMGMGEPFLNYDNLMKALDIISHDMGPNIARRHIVISTAGVVPALERFIKERQKYRLAISLNATSDEVRNQIIPINQKWPIKTLLRLAKEYTRISRERITFEYVLLAGVNDSLNDARNLRTLLRDIRCKVNLIPYNTTVRGFARPTEEKVVQFYQALLPLQAPVTIRWSRGADIEGGCGQLITTVAQKRKTE